MTDSTSPSKPPSKPDHPSQLPKENHSPETTSQTTEDNTSRDNVDDDVTCDDVTCGTDNVTCDTDDVTCEVDDVTCETEDVKQTSTCCAAQQSEGLELELQTSFHVWYQTDLSREHAEELLIKQPIG